MDIAKLNKLKELGYQILPTCGRCKHGLFKGYEWGTCALFTYEHQKHSGTTRQLSIHQSGYCGPDNFKPKETEDLHGFREFEV